MTTFEEEKSDQCSVNDLLRSASALSIANLDLSRKGIVTLPDDFPSCPKLECLYLEGNQLKDIPDALINQCPSLRWLDLRNNSISSIPSTINQLRLLRTLLLEGNNITTLPPQLGALKQLNGLSLARNPLQSPPLQVVQKGTKAVLKYLRDIANIDEEQDSEDNSDEEFRLHLEPLSVKKNARSAFSRPTKSDLLFRQATLHSLTELRRKQDLQNFQEMQLRKGENKKRRKQHRKSKQPATMLNEILEKQRGQQSLDNWRDETRQLQRAEKPREFKDPPYATHKDNEISSISQNSLEAESEGVMTEWVKDYAKQLQHDREQSGLLPNVTSELVNAEQKLAEALAMRKHFEHHIRQRTKNYRLRAFTGDFLP